MAIVTKKLTAEINIDFDVTINDVDGLPIVDMEGWKGWMEVRDPDALPADPAVATFTTDSSADGDLVLGADGSVQIKMDEEFTRLWPEGSYVYDLKVENEAGLSMRILKGTFVIQPTITQLP